MAITGKVVKTAIDQRIFVDQSFIAMESFPIIKSYPQGKVGVNLPRQAAAIFFTQVCSRQHSRHLD